MILFMLRGLINGLTDILYPKTCHACKRKLNSSSVDNLICLECWNKIKKNSPPFCHSCGRHLGARNFAKNICPACVRAKLHFDRAFSPCAYDGVVKELIHQFKYGNKDYLAAPLSRLMIEHINEYNLPINFIDVIVPVPLHQARLREREFNQAEALSRFISKKFNKDISLDLISRHRHTKSQTDLAPQERFENVKNSFRVNKNRDIKSKNILLVDDVLTTAATCSEAALALKTAGAGIVFVLTLAN